MVFWGAEPDSDLCLTFKATISNIGGVAYPPTPPNGGTLAFNMILALEVSKVWFFGVLNPILTPV